MNMENIHPVDQINLFLVVVPAKLSCSLIIATHLIICIDSATNTNLVVKLVSAHVLKGFMTKHTVGIVAVGFCTVHHMMSVAFYRRPSRKILDFLIT